MDLPRSGSSEGHGGSEISAHRLGRGGRAVTKLRRFDESKWWEEAFIQSLVQASTCRGCASRQSSVSWDGEQFVCGVRRQRKRLEPYRTTRTFATTGNHQARAPEQPTTEREWGSGKLVRKLLSGNWETQEKPRQGAGPERHSGEVPRTPSEVPSKDQADESQGEAGDNPDQAANGISIISKDEYRALVNTYGEGDDFLNESTLGSIMRAAQILDRTPHAPLASRLVYTPEQEERQQPREPLPPEDEGHAEDLGAFDESLGRPLGRISLSDLWDQYLALRRPRLRYLSNRQIQRFLRHLAWVEYKDSVGGQRFFALLEECLGEKITVDIAHWNTAISFAGKWVQKSSAEEVKRAVETWKHMEEHGVKADNVTFNILFDVSVKAGRFGLADTIYRELTSRDLPLNRYLRTSVIYYAGLRGDGDAVRQSFRELVNAGEIVDTAVMNTVIQALIRAGEPAAAEGVFMKMKRLSEDKFDSPIMRDWQERKALTQELTKVGEKLRKKAEDHESTFFGSQYSTDALREEIQGLSPIGPDVWTYGILLKWHCELGGKMSIVRALLNEMHQREFVITNAIYIALFQGFHKHGGHSDSEWSRRALEKCWADFLAYIPEGNQSGVESQESEPPPRKPTLEELFYSSNEFPENIDLSAVLDPEDSTSSDPNSTPEATSALEPADAPETEREDIDYSLENKPPHFTRSLCAVVIRAFWTCAGGKRMMEVWAEMQTRWPDMKEQERADLMKIIKRYNRLDSVYL